jgi:transcriptional regulator with XRE-family HTH domain
MVVSDQIPREEAVPELLAEARRASGLSQAEVARRAGTSRPTVSAYENGHRNPTLDTVERLLAVNGQQLALVPVPLFERRSDRRGKPFFIPDQLPRLTTASALGTIVLPPHVDWSTSGVPRELSDRRQRILAYQALLGDGEPQDITRFVDGTLLVDAWPEMHLPAAIREAWQPLIDRAIAGIGS